MEASEGLAHLAPAHSGPLGWAPLGPNGTLEPIGQGGPIGGPLSPVGVGKCGGCGAGVREATLLSVGGALFHSDCLRCRSCAVLLGDFPSCYVRDALPYCKLCYKREFGIKCSRCKRVIEPSDWIRRARQLVYHLACFACDQCKRQLSTGEEFALQDSKILCKQHYMELIDGESAKVSSKKRTKRVRTTFTEEQLGVLQQNFAVDSNPDGQDLERIASATGLSKRVTQVWFQNSRARQKKYQGGGGKKEGGGLGGLGGSDSEDEDLTSFAHDVDCASEDAPSVTGSMSEVLGSAVDDSVVFPYHLAHPPHPAF